MLNCKQVTKLVSESLDRDLPLGARIAVRIHLLYCRGCVRYARQVRMLRKAVAHLVTTVEDPIRSPDAGLSAEARTRIQHAIDAHGSSDTATTL